MKYFRVHGILLSIAFSFPLLSEAKTVNLLQQEAHLGFSPNAGALQLIVDAIQGAQKSIDMATLLITSDSIYNALIDSHNRGVKIRIVVDSKSANTSGSDVQRLIDNNIAVKLNSEFRIMHNKYFIIDGQSVETGSFNYSENADKRNAENAIFLYNQPNIAKLYSEIFERLFADSNKLNNVYDYNEYPNEISNYDHFSIENTYEYSAKSKNMETKIFEIEKGKVDVAFSKACNYINDSQSAKDLVLNVIKNSKNSIYMAAYNFSDPDIIAFLKIAQKNGVQLNIVLDYKANYSNSAVDNLKELGANIYLNKKFNIMHNKYIISDNDTVEFGSFNYTSSANEDQCNNVLVFYKQNDLTKYYMEDWNMLYQTSKK
ncbi:phospholipase D-like domain-containing protein [Silvanigrella aquatica]|uniref:phospholipase D n=1 Tax=Silvanigrella aquatica TaxID=1915309 RepID=A0A1L4D070_9BACT|nr:phospholipase D-like domain-containing protein [Silvanigrella aquatica]APJ03588.1 hypothetical protein AXG55_06575 [Silvanigrella aquatica]